MVCMDHSGTNTASGPTMYDYITISCKTDIAQEVISDRNETIDFQIRIIRTVFYSMLLLKHYVEKVARPPPLKVNNDI